MATTVSIKNINKPSPPIWKKIGNWAIYGVLPVTIAVAKFFVPEPYKSLIIELAAILMPLIKGATKLTFNPEQVPLSYFPQPETPQQPATKDVTKEVEKIKEVKADAEEKLIKDSKQ